MSAEFKIARLRFNWAGIWASGTTYNRDAVIGYEGKTYVCLVPHTAGDFYQDIGHVTSGGALTPYWQLTLDGKTWHNAWTPNTYYSLGNIVTYGGVVYVCKTNHTSDNSDQPQIDLTKWDTLSTFAKWDNLWTPNTIYGIGDMVKYGGIVYSCNTNHISAVDYATGLEADQSNWSLINNGIEYKLNWQSGVRYKKNDLVKEGADLYICNTGHTSVTLFDGAKFTLWLPGLEFSTTWSSVTIYEPGDVVMYGGYSFVSITVNNQGNIPSTSGSNWSVVNQGFNMRSEWDTTVSYKIGDVVTRHGYLFEAAQDTLFTTITNIDNTTSTVGNDPTGFSIQTTITSLTTTTMVVGSGAGLRPGMVIISAGFSLGQSIVSVNGTTVIISAAANGSVSNNQTINFVGVNYAYWQLLSPGQQWQNRWQYTTDYVAGDVVVWSNRTYQCIQNHTSTASGALSPNRPDYDTTNTYWIVLALHAKKNAMNTIGDLEAFDGQNNTAIAIGKKDQILKSKNLLPAWSDINQVANVYYVCTNSGVDDAAHGTSWDKPWKTIRYACDTIGTGQQYLNAAYMIQANRDWLITEMYQWMLLQKSTSTSPFTPSSTFDKVKTYRDAEYVLDAICYDMTRGGNSQTVAATLAYFAESFTNKFFNTTVAAEMPFFIAALTRLQYLVTSYAVQNVALPSLNSSQISNGIATTLLVNQVIDSTNHPIESGAISAITVLMNILLTALQNQSTLAVPAANQGITATIFVKTGTYSELLPIVVPENVAIVGDELRGTVIQPKLRINTTVTNTTASDNSFTVTTTAGLYDGCPVQFSGAIDIGAGTLSIGGITTGQTFYVNTLNNANVGTKETDSIQYLNGGLTHPDGHSKILGFALDGYPVYGPYGYTQANNANSAPKRMQSGYTLNSSNTRVSPATDTNKYPMGIFNEDYSFTNPAGSDLDAHNGRYCVTPDYPNGTYAYFATINSSGKPAYPYVLGKTFYGVPNPGYSIYTGGGGSAPAGYSISFTTQKSNFDGLQSSWTLSTDGGTMKFKGKGVPSHSFGNAASANNPTIQNYNLSFAYRGGTNVPAVGGFTSVGSGAIGYWLNGVAMFSPSAAQGSPSGFTAVSGYTYNASFEAGAELGYSFGEDLSGGHAAPGGVYHYHDFTFASAWTTGTGSTLVGSQLTSTKFSLSSFPGGPVFPIQTQSAGKAKIYLYGGDALQDMFRLRNGTGLRNMTFTGLLGSLSGINQYLTQRPTGGSYAALDPGKGPNDTSAWIFRRSPYTQNCTVFGYGCTGIKIDGDLHTGGNKSIVANDYTTILSGGVGVWCTGTGALTELVSVFAYYSYSGYLAEAGGRIRATNGNTSYGTYGVIAEGYDLSETPISGVIFNKSTQVQAGVQSSLSGAAQLIAINYSNSGGGYTTTTTNLLQYSNNLLNGAWTNDGNVLLNKNAIAPTGYSEAWSLTGTTSGTDSAYLTQTVSIPQAGAFYSAQPATNTSGSGIGATFDITVTSTGYLASVNSGGSGYVTGNSMYISGATLGGVQGGVGTGNDCILTVTSLAGSAILQVQVTGTVPVGSARKYTLSAYVKYGSAASIDLDGIFSGSSTVRSSVNFNFTTGVVTPSSDGNGNVPTQYGVVVLPNSWYRLWMAINDTTGLNTNLQYKIYSRGRSNAAGYTYFYGGQLELSQTVGTPSFYYETTVYPYTSYANFNVVGSGTGAVLVGDETRSNSIFQSRLTDPGTGAGGANYLTASNNAQGGTDQYILLAGSDTKTATNYIGMRVFINSGTGAGQYGYISDFDSAVSKKAGVLKESFDTIKITSTTTGTNAFNLAPNYDVNLLYTGMPVKFIPTYYQTSVTSASIGTVLVTSTVGGTYNQVVVASTAQLRVNQAVTFYAADNTQSLFGGVTGSYQYYVSSIIDGQTIQIAATLYGTAQQLQTVSNGAMTLAFPANTSYYTGLTANMAPNLVIQFTGTGLGGITTGNIYYIQDIIDYTTFTVATTLNTISPTATTATGNAITATSADVGKLIALNPIVFAGTTTGTNLVEGNKYYISKIINSTQFQVSSSLLTQTATATQVVSNLITVGSTAGFVANNPIVFIGNTFGNLQNETVYYILAINDTTSFTVSSQPGGSAVGLQTSTGQMIVKTAPAAFGLATQATVSGLVGSTTNAKTILSAGTGVMNAQFQTSLFGNVQAGTTYYINTFDTIAKTFTVTATQGSGSAFALATKTGSMNIGAIGWDHVIAGTPIVSVLDSSAVYYVEPRLTYADPAFSQMSATLSTQLPGNYYVGIASGGGNWIAIPNTSTSASISTNGTTWSNITLPTAATWTDIAYGNGMWVVISSGGFTGSTVAYSTSAGAGWRTTAQSLAAWSSLAYGQGRFVCIATGSTSSAYSTNGGQTWVTGSGLGNLAWSDLAYGKGLFVAVAAGSRDVYTSPTGATWTQRANALPASSSWSNISYGNNRFIAISSTSQSPAYSFDGITWYSANTTIAADKLEYGQGVFLALSASSTSAWTSEDGVWWKSRTVSNDGYADIAFGFTAAGDGMFLTVASQTTGSKITAGTRTKARPVVTSGVITSISEFEPGSNYITTTPTVSITDPNVTTAAVIQTRVGSGALANPTFVNKGTGYNTNSTAITITGNGYSDAYQTGLTLIMNNLSRLPQPGDNLAIAGNSKIYKVTNATAMFGTTSPNIEANVQISPDMSVALSPADGTAVQIRQKYSQARLTGHDFLDIGTGDVVTTNYPKVDTLTDQPQNQTVETNYGRVFYTSTDQDGNFKVGTLFGVQQATGIVTLSASQFGLTGLNTLSLGGIAVGGSSVVITQFSTDQTFVANSNTIIPTQKAIKSYLTGRLSQGGSNTFTGQLIAGTVLVGGPDKIGSTIPAGTNGSNVKVINKMVFQQNGGYGQVDGNYMAMDLFFKGAFSRG